MAIRQAVFGAGCYWGVEACFRRIPGVVDVCVGYMGDRRSGQAIPASDEEAHGLGHVEVVLVVYDPGQVTYESLLDGFWDCHDPTRPACDDAGKLSLERSVVFVGDDGQKTLADASLAAVIASGKFDAPITTTVDRVGHFHRARESQQRYLEKNEAAVCSVKHLPADAAA